MRKAYTKTVGILSSNKFFYFVIVVCVLQAAWYAFSFMPSVFDEGKHLGNIFIYSHHLSPFLGQQNPAWDHLGQITREGSYLFYYIMSWPLRFISLFTQDKVVQIIFLRFINIGFFVGGLIYFRKLLLDIPKASKALVNTSLLLFVITPSIALMPGAVNYDNLLFFIFAAILYLSIQILTNRSVSFVKLSEIIILSIMLSLVKWTSIVLVVPIVMYLCYDLYQKHRLDFFNRLKVSFKKTGRITKYLFILGLVVSVMLFIERPVYNFIAYHKFNPSCSQVISEQRCESFPQYVIYSKIDANKSPNFKPTSPPNYLLTIWTPRMINTSVNSLEQPTSTLPVVKLAYSTFALLSIGLVLIYIKDFLKFKQYKMLVFVIIFFISALIYTEYSAYIKHGVPAAIRLRYLVPILPIFFYLVLLSTKNLFEKRKYLMLPASILIIILLSQGGSIITYALTTPTALYWSNSQVHMLNDSFKNVLHPMVKE